MPAPTQNVHLGTSGRNAQSGRQIVYAWLIDEGIFVDGQGTKYAPAEIVAKRFSELKLPFKRKTWQSEYSRMNIFDAVALALIIKHGDF